MTQSVGLKKGMRCKVMFNRSGIKEGMIVKILDIKKCDSFDINARDKLDCCLKCGGCKVKIKENFECFGDTEKGYSLMPLKDTLKSLIGDE